MNGYNSKTKRQPAPTLKLIKTVNHKSGHSMKLTGKARPIVL